MRPPRQELAGGDASSEGELVSGYVSLGGLDLYYERHGVGPPLVLLHGAFGTIESCFAGLLPVLARNFEVVAVELQGHGRTRDVDRPLSYEGMARDVAGLLDALEIARAHLVGYSLGGAVGLQLALDRPELVERVVYAGGASFDPAACTPSSWRASNRLTPTSWTGRAGTRRTAKSRPTLMPGPRSSSR